MCKRAFLLIICLFIFTDFFSQKEKVDYLPTFDKQRFNYGFYLGLNQNDFKINFNSATQSIQSTSNTGFNVGLIADVRLHNNINLRFEPGLISGSRTLFLNNTTTPERKADSRYLHVPLVFKFSSDRIKNIRPYVLAGISYDFNFNSAQASENNNNNNATGSKKLGTTAHNFMYEVGVGLDIYLFYVKLSPSIRGVFAINNELDYSGAQANEVAAISYLGTRGIFLNLAFEGFRFFR